MRWSPGPGIERAADLGSMLRCIGWVHGSRAFGEASKKPGARLAHGSWFALPAVRPPQATSKWAQHSRQRQRHRAPRSAGSGGTSCSSFGVPPGCASGVAGGRRAGRQSMRPAAGPSTLTDDGDATATDDVGGREPWPSQWGRRRLRKAASSRRPPPEPPATRTCASGSSDDPCPKSRSSDEPTRRSRPGSSPESGAQTDLASESVHLVGHNAPRGHDRPVAASAWFTG